MNAPGQLTDEPGKIRVVGCKTASHYHPGGLKAAEPLLQTLRRMPGGQSIAPHGVYRFRSHEEADEWLMKMLTRPGRAPRR